MIFWRFKVVCAALLCIIINKEQLGILKPYFQLVDKAIFGQMQSCNFHALSCFNLISPCKFTLIPKRRLIISTKANQLLHGKFKPGYFVEAVNLSKNCLLQRATSIWKNIHLKIFENYHQTSYKTFILAIEILLKMLIKVT